MDAIYDNHIHLLFNKIYARHLIRAYNFDRLSLLCDLHNDRLIDVVGNTALYNIWGIFVRTLFDQG
jgi:hypothetical protein